MAYTQSQIHLHQVLALFHLSHVVVHIYVTDCYTNYRLEDVALDQDVRGFDRIIRMTQASVG